VRIYIQPDCPYCERLRKEIVPEIVKEFGTRVRIEYRSADDLPGIRRTPTLILDPRRAESRPRIIEGLPTLERLRGAIRDLEVSL
jgi:thiol-disulfide isomerase/thioredoxin